MRWQEVEDGSGRARLAARDPGCVVDFRTFVHAVGPDTARRDKFGRRWNNSRCRLLSLQIFTSWPHETSVARSVSGRDVL
jgi:hypothetical protein